MFRANSENSVARRLVARFAPQLLLVALLLAALSSTKSIAAETYVPPELESWVEWVLHDHPNLNCPRVASSGKTARCVWINSLTLDVATDLKFEMSVRVFAESRIQLPGNVRHWPTQVTANEQPVSVIGGGARPAVILPPGSYTVAGNIDWGKRPNELQLPDHTGLIALTLDGAKIARPTRNSGALLLGKRASNTIKTERNSLSVDAYRLLADAYPMTLETTLMLSVSGQPRLAEIGRVLLEGFEMSSFESSLPARLNSAGNLEVQVEPGQHRVVISARATGIKDSPTLLKPAAQTENWPKQEIWGFLPNRNLRLVNLSGAAPIDLSQTSAPFNREEVQGYLLDAASALELSVQQRGTPNPTPNRFGIVRDLWLAFDGSGYVVRDRLEADINHASRLSASYALGRVSVDGEDELINSLDGHEPGIELQSGNYQIGSISKIGRTEVTHATGWQIDTDSLAANLHLPPGWRLLWATGVDKTPDAWLSRWSLWKIFVLVLLGVLAWRFLSRGFALILVLATALMMHTAPSLAVVWLVAIVLLASVRHIEHAGALKLLRAVSFAWIGLAALLAIGEAVTHARQAVYPQLEHHSALQNYGYSDSYLGIEAELADQAFRPESDAINGSVLESVVVEKAQSTSRSGSFTSSPKRTRPQKKYGDGLQVQTGPGQPRWGWNNASLMWDGPVSAQQTLSLTLMPPAVTRAINLLVALLLVGVSALMLLPLIARDSKLRIPAGLGRIAPLQLPVLLPIALFACLCAPTNDVQAAAIDPAPVDPAILKQLESRLLATPRCFPNCASVQRASISADQDQLTINLTLHSAELVSLPLPGSNVWNPSRVTLNDNSATLARAKSGALEIALPAGQHQLQLVGPIAHLTRFELNLPLNPAAIDTRVSDGWLISGIVDGRVARGSLGFERRTASSEQDKTLKPAAAKPFVLIDRILRFDQEWSMETTVTRRSPKVGGFSMDIPLLFDEAVLNDSIDVKNDQARLVFGRNDRVIRWTSRIAPTNSLQLIAPPVSSAAARWTLSPSNFWHLEYSGLNPVAEGPSTAGPTFLPETGETLDVQLTQTTPVAGTTLTIENVDHRIIVGARQQRHELRLNTLASQGGTLRVTLAQTSSDSDNAESATGNTLVSVEVDGRAEPIGLIEDNVLPLPLTPGSTSYSVVWLENTPRGALFRVAETKFDGPASNITTSVSMSQDRWVLLLGGPKLGPGILYWGLLLVVLLLALLISRIPGLPFTGTDAILLSLGLSLANLPATLLIALWVIALRFRSGIVDGLKADWSRNLLQIASAGLSVITVFTLIASVPSALLGTPNMQVEGNGSSAYFYNWFSDQTAGALPTAWVLSLPLWVYRVIMLVWSLWLAFALIRWVPWAWQQWAKPQMWYSTKKPDGFSSARTETTQSEPTP